MIFKLKTSSWDTPDPVRRAKLEELGFKFKSWRSEFSSKTSKPNMVKQDGVVEVNVPDLQSLLTFSEEWGDLIISASDRSIEIYDDYRE